MSYWNDTSATTYSYSYVTTNRHYSEDMITIIDDSKPRKKGGDMKFHSDPLKKILEAKLVKNRITVFAYRKSPIFHDANIMGYYGVSPYFTDPVLSGYDAPPKLAAYSFAIVIDALEYVVDKMSRANIIKEAMATLNYDRKKSFVIILTKTPKMVEELAEKNGYEKTESGFLIPEKAGQLKKYRGLTIKGLDVDELIDIAHFAGAQYIYEDKTLETDLACVKIYLYKQE